MRFTSGSGFSGKAYERDVMAWIAMLGCLLSVMICYNFHVEEFKFDAKRTEIFSKLWIFVRISFKNDVDTQKNHVSFVRQKFHFENLN